MHAYVRQVHAEPECVCICLSVYVRIYVHVVCACMQCICAYVHTVCRHAGVQCVRAVCVCVCVCVCVRACVTAEVSIRCLLWTLPVLFSEPGVSFIWSLYVSHRPQAAGAILSVIPRTESQVGGNVPGSLYRCWDLNSRPYVDLTISPLLLLS